MLELGSKSCRFEGSISAVMRKKIHLNGLQSAGRKEREAFSILCDVDAVNGPQMGFSARCRDSTGSPHHPRGILFLMEVGGL